MKHFYSEINGVTLTFSDIAENPQGFEEISVRFERVNDSGFDFAEGKLPQNMLYKTYGFSEDELLQMSQYLRNNAALIWKIAMREGEETIA